MSNIKFGPTGIGPVGDAVENLEMYRKLGFKAAEVLFTYGVYIKEKEDAVKIGKVAEKLGIFLSVHAPYWVNLNSKDEKKIEMSKARILKCCEVASWLGAKRVVFHPGFYSNSKSLNRVSGVRIQNSGEEDFQKIKEGVVEMMGVVEENGWDVELCPEVMGKVNVFGSIDEVGRLVRETGCGVCIDFAHVLARYKNYEFEKIKDEFKLKNWHVHFSGIEYGEKGERKHLVTPVEEWKKVLGFLKGLDKNIVLICESPDAVGDSIVGMREWEEG
ncbi:MAG: TIM barrel protein [archaeon]